MCDYLAVSQVEQVIQKNGGLDLETHERDVTEMKLSARGTQINTLDQRTEEPSGDVMMERRLINGLQKEKSPSFKLNKGAEQVLQLIQTCAVLFLETRTSSSGSDGAKFCPRGAGSNTPGLIKPIMQRHSPCIPTCMLSTLNSRDVRNKAVCSL